MEVTCLIAFFLLFLVVVPFSFTYHFSTNLRSLIHTNGKPACNQNNLLAKMATWVGDFKLPHSHCGAFQSGSASDVVGVSPTSTMTYDNSRMWPWRELVSDAALDHFRCRHIATSTASLCSRDMGWSLVLQPTIKCHVGGVKPVWRRGNAILGLYRPMTGCYALRCPLMSGHLAFWGWSRYFLLIVLPYYFRS